LSAKKLLQEEKMALLNIVVSTSIQSNPQDQFSIRISSTKKKHKHK